MKALSTPHQFAFYTEYVSLLHKNAAHSSVLLQDLDLVHRIATILRLEKGEEVVLFDAHHHCPATITVIDPRRSILVDLHEINENKRLSPTVEWLLPLLKREAFEESLYTLAELGATSIQPVFTHKTNRFWSEKDEVRCKKILIAAAEQSKQYALPQIQPILPLDIWLMKAQSPLTIKIFFDPQGIRLRETFALIEHQKLHHIIALAGPEGDLTYEEKLMVTDQGFIFCALTPTVLRAQQAIAVGLGAMRSMLI